MKNRTIKELAAYIKQEALSITASVNLIEAWIATHEEEVKDIIRRNKKNAE